MINEWKTYIMVKFYHVSNIHNAKREWIPELQRKPSFQCLSQLEGTYYLICVVELEEARRMWRLGDHLAMPAPPPHQVHLALLVVELHVEEGCIFPPLSSLNPQLLLATVFKNNVLFMNVHYPYFHIFIHCSWNLFCIIYVHHISSMSFYSFSSS